MDLLEKDLTERVIGACFEVANELGDLGQVSGKCLSKGACYCIDSVGLKRKRASAASSQI